MRKQKRCLVCQMKWRNLVILTLARKIEREDLGIVTWDDNHKHYSVKAFDAAVSI